MGPTSSKASGASSAASSASTRSSSSSSALTALRIAGVFFLISALWIVFSDRLLLQVFSASTLERITHVQMIKGTAFVFAVTVLLYLLIYRSLEKLRRAKESADSASEELRLLVDGVTDYSMLMLDPSGTVIRWNRGAQRQHDYRAEEILGKHFSLFYPPEDIKAGKPERALALARAEGRFEDEGWCLRLDGSRYWAHVVITALLDESGRLRGFSTITRDLSERKQVETLLQQQLQQKQQSGTGAPPPPANPSNTPPPAVV